MTHSETAIAEGLSEAQRRFLADVCDGRKLRLADRTEDKVRQSLRRLGLVHVVPNPRRWQASPLGLRIRSYLISKGS